MLKISHQGHETAAWATTRYFHTVIRSVTQRVIPSHKKSFRYTAIPSATLTVILLHRQSFCYTADILLHSHYDTNSFFVTAMKGKPKKAPGQAGTRKHDTY